MSEQILLPDRPILQTDGGRGLYVPDGALGQMTEPTFELLSYAAAMHVRERDGVVPEYVIVHDPRKWNDTLVPAIYRGLVAAGARVRAAGMLPTPVAAKWAYEHGVHWIAATPSHNPPPDCGIKLGDKGGIKFPEADKLAIEDSFRQLAREHGGIPFRYSGGQVIESHESVRDWYVGRLLEFVGGEGILSGWKHGEIILDAANGAASFIGPTILEKLGAKVHAVNCDANGSLINLDSGVEHMDAIVRLARAMGLAALIMDGDADRNRWVDQRARKLWGEHIISWLLRASGERPPELKGGVSTAYSNGVFWESLDQQGIESVQVINGDQQVYEQLVAHGWDVGGESSGHVNHLKFSPMGDALFIGALMLSRLRESGHTVADVRDALPEFYPQVQIKVKGVDMVRAARDLDPDADSRVKGRMRLRLEEERQRQRWCRELTRPSGTEPLVRVMAEGADGGMTQQLAEDLAGIVREELVPAV